MASSAEGTWTIITIVLLYKTKISATIKLSKSMMMLVTI